MNDARTIEERRIDFAKGDEPENKVAAYFKRRAYGVWFHMDAEAADLIAIRPSDGKAFCIDVKSFTAPFHAMNVAGKSGWMIQKQTHVDHLLDLGYLYGLKPCFFFVWPGCAGCWFPESGYDYQVSKIIEINKQRGPFYEFPTSEIQILSDWT